MDLDFDACYRALQTRDARFDGRFFTGVKTTGIYCRPICPARTPFRKMLNSTPRRLPRRRPVFVHACAAALRPPRTGAPGVDPPAPSIAPSH